jgi:hypothetical protein
MPLAEDLALLAAWAAGSVPGRAARMRAHAGSRVSAGCPVGLRPGELAAVLSGSGPLGGKK